MEKNSVLWAGSLAKPFYCVPQVLCMRTRISFYNSYSKAEKSMCMSMCVHMCV